MALRAGLQVKWIARPLGAAVLCLVNALGVAELTGLASGETAEGAGRCVWL
ncbi:MAG: hypothetical protein WA110_09210 [Anaerolineaceae bacterium]